MRSQFAFYKSFDDVYQDLNNNQKLEFINVLLDVQFLRVKINDVAFKDNILKHIWNAQKHSIEKSIKGYLESQKNQKIKEPFLGVYDCLNIPSEGNFNILLAPSEGICKQEQEKEKEKEEYTYEFNISWDWYKENTCRPAGDKAKAYKSYLKHLKKIDNDTIKKCIYNYVQECNASNSFTKHLVTFLNSDIEEYNYVPNVQKTATKKQEDEILI